MPTVIATPKDEADPFKAGTVPWYHRTGNQPAGIGPPLEPVSQSQEPPRLVVASNDFRENNEVQPGCCLKIKGQHAFKRPGENWCGLKTIQGANAKATITPR